MYIVVVARLEFVVDWFLKISHEFRRADVVFRLVAILCVFFIYLFQSKKASNVWFNVIKLHFYVQVRIIQH